MPLFHHLGPLTLRARTRKTSMVIDGFEFAPIRPQMRGPRNGVL